MKTFEIGDILDEAEYMKIISIIQNETAFKKVKTVCKKVIKPKMKFINERLGEKNDPMYIAYAVTFAIESTIMNRVAKGIIEKNGEEYLKEEENADQ